jgi:hypothetical protein
MVKLQQRILTQLILVQSGQHYRKEIKFGFSLLMDSDAVQLHYQLSPINQELNFCGIMIKQKVSF